MSVSTLNEICKVDWGNTNLTKKAYSDNGEFLGVSAAGVDGRMDFFEHQKGVTVISAIGANCGRVFFPEDRFTAIKNTITLTPNTDILYPKYLFYTLQNNRIPKRGAGQPFVTKGDTGKYKIFLPSLPEQKRIVGILEKADVLNKKRQEVNELSNKIIQAVFLEMFGEPTTNPKKFKMGKILEGISETKYGTSTATNDKGRGCKVIRMGNIINGYLDLNNMKYVELNDKEIAKYILRKGDILFNRTNSKELVGKTALFHNDRTESYVAASYLIIVRVNQGILTPEFLWAYMNTNYMKEKLIGMCRQAVNMANINATEFKNILIYFPSICEQQKFTNFIQKIEKIKERQSESEEDIDKLFNSLMQKMLNK